MATMFETGKVELTRSDVINRAVYLAEQATAEAPVSATAAASIAAVSQAWTAIATSMDSYDVVVTTERWPNVDRVDVD